MACETRVGDFDVKSSPISDWQHSHDCLPLISPASERRIKHTKPPQGRRSKERTNDTKVKVKHKKWSFSKVGTEGGESDEERLINETSRDDLIDLEDEDTSDKKCVEKESRSLTSNGDKSSDTQSTLQIRKLKKSEEGRSGSDEELLTNDAVEEFDITEVSRDHTSVKEEAGRIPLNELEGNLLSTNDFVGLESQNNVTYITPKENSHRKAELKEDVAGRLVQAEDQVCLSLQEAISILDEKKTFLLRKLQKLKQKKEKDAKEREKNKSKTPIQVLKSPRASPTPASDSDNDFESVFVRKKVIRTDKRKMELKLMAEIDVVLSKVKDIGLAAQKIKYMTPFLEAKISADLDSDEETPDLVDVLAITINDKHIVMTTDFKNSSLKSFIHCRGEVTNSVLKFDNSPWGITRMDMNTVTVSIPLANKLCLVDVSSGVRLEETIRTKKQYYGLVSIGSSLIVATSPYSNPRSVDTLDLNGAVLKTMVIDSLLQQPSFICSTPTGGFVLSDLSKGALLGVTNTLELERGFEIEDEVQLQSSRGVTANQNGDVFVVDYRQKKVKVFSGQGRFIKDILTSEESLKYPYGICFDREGHLFVTDGGMIKIFSF